MGSVADRLNAIVAEASLEEYEKSLNEARKSGSVPIGKPKKGVSFESRYNDSEHKGQVKNGRRGSLGDKGSDSGKKGAPKLKRMSSPAMLEQALSQEREDVKSEDEVEPDRAKGPRKYRVHSFTAGDAIELAGSHEKGCGEEEESRGKKMKRARVRPEFLSTIERERKRQIEEAKKKRASLFFVSRAITKAKSLRKREKIRKLLWLFLSEPDSSPYAYVFSIISMIIIFVSTLSFCLETVPEIIITGGKAPLFIIETSCIAFFTLELLLRFSSAKSHKLFCKSPSNLIDLMAIAPYYIELVLFFSKIEASSLSSIGIIRAIRIFRVFRVLKVTRHSMSLTVFAVFIKNTVSELAMLVVLVFLATLIFSALMYYIESDTIVVPEAFNNTTEFYIALPETNEAIIFSSIPSTFWWCIVTLTTVGYGDVVPKSVLGKILASAIMLFGMVLLVSCKN
uniref:Ion transport domain-containing protein n=1 Tax=Palpitomonas bilix TaxID=652834 RepID=A0A7S3G535_9EUKA|mmetsp:Transcript_27085/g.69729  ORF Transcript_27085/g.69729 Transcript_27085/m.69729 type:complete len:453 (+) Transcript_27085:1054-2412(+)